MTLYHRNSFVPLDDYLNITILPYKITVLMMLKLARMGMQYSSYQAMSQALKKHDDIFLSDDELRYVLNYIATFAYLNKLQEARECLHLFSDSNDERAFELSKKPHGTLYVEILGSELHALEAYFSNESVEMPNFMGKDHADRAVFDVHCFDEKSHIEPNDAHLSAVTVYSEKNIVKLHAKTEPQGTERERLIHRDMVICGHNKMEFMQLLYGALAKSKILEHETLVLLGDGSRLFHDLAVHLRTILPKNIRVIEIVDYAFLEKFITDCARQTFKSMRGMRAFASKLLCLLCEGKYQKALECISLYELKDNANKVLYEFFLKHEQFLNYALFLKKGYLIGKGEVEEHERQIFEKRLTINLHSHNCRLKQYFLNLMLSYDNGNFYHEIGDTLIQAFSEGMLPSVKKIHKK